MALVFSQLAYLAIASSWVQQLLTLQRAGGKALPAADWLRGFALQKGNVLGEAADTATPGAGGKR